MCSGVCSNMCINNFLRYRQVCYVKFRVLRESRCDHKPHEPSWASSSSLPPLLYRLFVHATCTYVHLYANRACAHVHAPIIRTKAPIVHILGHTDSYSEGQQIDSGSARYFIDQRSTWSFRHPSSRSVASFWQFREIFLVGSYPCINIRTITHIAIFQVAGFGFSEYEHLIKSYFRAHRKLSTMYYAVFRLWEAREENLL